jgi:hypothetical protein
VGWLGERVSVLRAAWEQRNGRRWLGNSQATENSSVKSRVIVATGSYIGEGFDDSRLYRLFLAMPLSGVGRCSNISVGFTDFTTARRCGSLQYIDSSLGATRQRRGRPAEQAEEGARRIPAESVSRVRVSVHEIDVDRGPRKANLVEAAT